MEAKFNEQWNKKQADVDVDFLWLKVGFFTGELNISNGRLFVVQYGKIVLSENRDSAISGTYLKFERPRLGRRLLKPVLNQNEVQLVLVNAPFTVSMESGET
ncbi:hypothetical protein [Pseudoalteromonas xiamenensis]|uniref:Uncharacterized protein n=1 Tax=Pseudoalteromonas xiamenensis TaxID=882626 RepID=A0A975HP72_9GAMM|nr:hypothetical protein [Pseudoalteromonas xiamenensis]QTH72970.1 hypothetical protein J5O05_17575 [Pseudoalteromonas xiamenensis]